MTTLAYRDGILAGDKLLTVGSSVIGLKSKVGRTSRFLYGASGASALCDAFMQWVKYGAKGEAPVMATILTEEKFSAVGVLISPKDIRTYVITGEQIMEHSEFAAFGSGADVARGAMAMGASAVKAVEIAAQFDIYTGGGVDCVSFA